MFIENWVMVAVRQQQQAVAFPGPTHAADADGIRVRPRLWKFSVYVRADAFPPLGRA
jgi:hypothetical protein